MQLLDFPLELLRPIFCNAVKIRGLQRAARLRLVNKAFKVLIDEALVSSDVFANDIFGTNDGWYCRTPFWYNIMSIYLARKTTRDHNPTQVRGQIRSIARRLCEMSGETGQEALSNCLIDLFGIRYRCACYGWRDLDIIGRESDRSMTEHQVQTLLFDAAVHTNRMEAVRTFLTASSKDLWRLDKRVKGCEFETPLRIAARRGNIDMVKLLLTADPSASDNNLIKPAIAIQLLYIAATNNHSHMFTYILDNSGSFDGYNKASDAVWPSNFASALQRVPSPRDYLRCIERLGDGSPLFSPEVCDDIVRLDMSALFGRVEMVSYFLTKGVDPNNPSTHWRRVHQTHTQSGLPVYRKSRIQPLMSAIQGGSSDVVRLLLHHGADPNRYGPCQTVLTAAVLQGCLSVVRLLVEHGADVNQGYPPPIVMAMLGENSEVFRYLRQKGARLDTPETGAWAAGVAAHYGLESMTELLAQEAVDVSARFYTVMTRDLHDEGFDIFNRKRQLDRKGRIYLH